MELVDLVVVLRRGTKTIKCLGNDVQFAESGICHRTATIVFFILKMNANMNMKMNDYWYRMYCGECPVCGRDCSYRKRVYGKKPTTIKKRYVQLTYVECYDWCDV